MAELLAHRAEQMSDAQRGMAIDRIFANAKELQQLIEDVTQAEALARRAARVQVRPLPLITLVRNALTHTPIGTLIWIRKERQNAEIAAQHGGRVWVEARVGGGTSFRLLLPTAAADRTQRWTDTSHGGQEPIDVGQQMVRVLVIDDDPNMTTLLNPGRPAARNRGDPCRHETSSWPRRPALTNSSVGCAARSPTP